MLRKLCVLSSVLFVLTLSLAAQDSRHFTFHYAFTVKNPPAGQKIRIWIPEAHSDTYQEVKVVSAHGDLPLKRTSESKYGNQIYRFCQLDRKFASGSRRRTRTPIRK